MRNSSLTRRDFVKTSVMAAAVASTGVLDTRAEGTRWPIGCFNRPWMQKTNIPAQPPETSQPTNWGFDVALKGMKNAGYRMIGLLTRTADEPFIGSSATPEYLASLKKRIADAELVATMAALHTKTNGSADEGTKEIRQQIDNAQGLGLQWLLTFGVDNPSEYETYCKIMTDAADYAQERHLKLVLKPHGGSSSSSTEIIDCLKKVGRPNFKIWYDAGNIIYYTDKDPVEELRPLAKYVTGFCAKDCAQKSGDVFIQLGKGKVNFRAVFTVLKDAGYAGPLFVECCAGKTVSVVQRAAQANRVFLENTLASI